MKETLYRLVARRVGYIQPVGFFEDKSLPKILQHAFESTSYYRRLFLESGIAVGGEVRMERFNQIPFLDKDILRACAGELISNRVGRSATYWNTSGGSTGEPVRFLQDKNYLRAARAITYRQKTWTGYRFGDRILKLWGDEREILHGGQSFKSRLTHLAKNLTLLNSFSMTPERMVEYVRVINAQKPKLIVAYAQAMYELCRFAEEQKLEMRGAQAVMTSAGTLHSFMRDTIERVCGVRVFNRYGTREVGNIASECDRHEGLHVSEGVHLEVVDEKGESCVPGSEGEIVITSLLNRSMPFIRYRIGDFGILSDRPCSCGRSGLLLKQVSGRVTDAFRTAYGKVIPAEYFIHIIGVVLNRGIIKKFQIVQEGFDRIRIRMVCADSLPEADQRDIEDKIKLVMGRTCSVDYEFVDTIPPLASGKYRYTISMV